MHFKKTDIVKVLAENMQRYQVDYQELFRRQKQQAIALVNENYKKSLEAAAHYRDAQIECIEAIRMGERNSPRADIVNNKEEMYQSAIDMFEMSHGDIVNLSFAEYLRYVKDRWDWKEEFDEAISKTNERRVEEAQETEEEDDES